MYTSHTATPMLPSSDRSTVYHRSGSTVVRDTAYPHDVAAATSASSCASIGGSTGMRGSTTTTVSSSITSTTIATATINREIAYAGDKELPARSASMSKKRPRRPIIPNQYFTSSFSMKTMYSSQRKAFAYLFLVCVAALGSIQFTLNAVLFESIHDKGTTTSTRIGPWQPLQEQIDALQARIRSLQEATRIYSRETADSDFYAFSIRDSRRLVPTQLPPDLHVWDYVDISSQNQQTTRQASLFHNAQYQAPAICQKYDLYCYKHKILQVFDLVLEQNPYTQFFFYMEADNELCVPLVEIQRIAHQYQRYFITTGIGFSGWIMRRDFVLDFIHALETFQPPPRNPQDILSQLGPPPSEGPDPIAADFLSRNNSWAVTRQYLVSHSIQPSLGIEALTVRMPTVNSASSGIAAAVAAAGGGAAVSRNLGQGSLAMALANTAAAKTARAMSDQIMKQNHTGLPAKKNLDKHLPRCLEPRRSKWRISKQDHRDRFGWDYFDYDHCQGQEIFPCYEGQLQELLAQDMAQFNYTQLDLERQKLIERDQERQRKRLMNQAKHQNPQRPQNPQPQDQAQKPPPRPASVIRETNSSTLNGDEGKASTATTKLAAIGGQGEAEVSPRRLLLESHAQKLREQRARRMQLHEHRP